MIKHINSIEEFEKEIQNGKVLIDFYATWCGPCRMLTPVIEELEEEGKLNNINVIKVDVDQLPELASRYNVFSIPNLFLLDNGQIINNQLGYQNKNQLLAFLNK